MKKLLYSVLLAALCLSAADNNVTGKWTGSFDITSPESENSTAVLDLKQDGMTITGTVGPNEEKRIPIVKGAIDGDKITLEAQGEDVIIKFDLVLAAGHIKGDAHGSYQGNVREAKLDVTRAK